MDMVKATAIQVLRNLRPQDILSVVAFSDRAEVIIPAAYHQERARLEAKIQMIQPSGATEIYQGLEAGVKEVMRSLDGKRVNHIILLTDGHTYGDEQQCLALASKLAETWDRHQRHGNWAGMERYFSGCPGHPNRRQQCLSLPSRRISSGCCWKNSMPWPRPTPKMLRLDTTVVEGVELAYAFRLQPDPSPIALGEDPLQLGSILQDTSTQVIFEYIIHPKAVKSESLDRYFGWYAQGFDCLPAACLSLLFGCTLKRPVSETRLRQSRRLRAIVQALSRLMLYRMQERARKEVEKGNIETATRQLQTPGIQSVVAG